MGPLSSKTATYPAQVRIQSMSAAKWQMESTATSATMQQMLVGDASTSACSLPLQPSPTHPDPSLQLSILDMLPKPHARCLEHPWKICGSTTSSPSTRTYTPFIQMSLLEVMLWKLQRTALSTLEGTSPTLQRLSVLPILVYLPCSPFLTQSTDSSEDLTAKFWAKTSKESSIVCVETCTAVFGPIDWQLVFLVSGCSSVPAV